MGVTAEQQNEPRGRAGARAWCRDVEAWGERLWAGVGGQEALTEGSATFAGRAKGRGETPLLHNGPLKGYHVAGAFGREQCYWRGGEQGHRPWMTCGVWVWGVGCGWGI